ncbi:MAG: hypothetical protein HOW73_46310 [Polyangiaceae bacterium]|nr:hypothetical protein [Polyangiaceae bacterium]
MSAVVSARAGARMAIARLQGRAAIAVAFVALVVPIIVALVERREATAGASDRALSTVFRFVVPLLTFSLSQLPIGGKNLRDAVWPAARFGLHRGFVALGHVAVGGAAGAIASLLAAVVAVLVARLGAPSGPSDMTLASDVVATIWIAPLVAFAYAAWFGLGATFGRSGGGRGYVLLADFLVGSLGVFGVLLPRGSAYNLIGLSAPLDVPQRAASGVLVAVTIVCAAVCALRCKR